MATKTALILAGAVARGAFEAGALAVLSERAADTPISRIVAASSGALNAAIYATGVRAGRELDVAERLAYLWQHEADWHHVFRLSPKALFRATGFGTADRLVPIMKKAMADIGAPPYRRRPVTLGLLLTTLDGELGEGIGGKPATTFEHCAEFQDEEFDTEAGRDRLVRTALGSAAFPGLFAPVEVPGVGPCVDGGAVNNTPVKRALGGGKVDRIIVVTSEPQAMRPKERLRGIGLVSQIAEILINERLYRDLHDAESVNTYLAKIESLAKKGVSADTIEEVKKIFGWSPLEIVQIRPLQPLEGDAFSAFSHPDQMRQYVEAGRDAARAALSDLSHSS